MTGPGENPPGPVVFVAFRRFAQRRGSVAAEEDLQHDGKPGVGQLKWRAVGGWPMTAGSITPKICGVVLVVGAHVNIAVPVVPIGVSNVVKGEIVGYGIKTTTGR
jgi:hypothetical protein